MKIKIWFLICTSLLIIEQHLYTMETQDTVFETTLKRLQANVQAQTLTSTQHNDRQTPSTPLKVRQTSSHWIKDDGLFDMEIDEAEFCNRSFATPAGLSDATRDTQSTHTPPGLPANSNGEPVTQATQSAALEKQTQIPIPALTTYKKRSVQPAQPCEYMVDTAWEE